MYEQMMCQNGMSVDLIVHVLVFLDVLQEHAVQCDGFRRGAQQQAGLVLVVEDPEVEFGLPWSFGYECGNVVDDVVIDSISIDGDSEFFDVVVAYRLQVLYVDNPHVDEWAVGKLLRELAAHEDGTANDEHAAPLSPFLTEEGKAARAFEIFDGNDTHGLA